MNLFHFTYGKKKLIFLILCGGKSTRAGFDKGLFLRESKPQVKVLYEMVQQNTNSPIFISIREEQFVEYSKFFSKEIFVIDSTNYAGPWNGIMSAYKLYSDMDIFVISCDLLNITWKYILNLLNFYEKTYYDFYMYKDSENIQTLCGIFSSKRLGELHKNSSFDMSIQIEVSKSNALLIPLRKEEELFFKNYNHAQDFKEIYS